MVRHEAAEALGSIATPEVLTTLKAHASPEEQSRVVRESCEVALDMVRPLSLHLVYSLLNHARPPS
jgi:HEAT repeat protein